MMEPATERLPLTVAEVAERLRCPRPVVIRLVLGGHLAAYRLGKTSRTWRIEADEIDRFIAEGGLTRDLDTD